jgi:hypothetical protein
LWFYSGRADLRSHAASFTVQRALENRSTANFAASVIGGGHLKAGGRNYELGPGGSLSVSFGREWLDDWRYHTFLSTSFGFSGTIAPTADRFGQKSIYAAGDVSFSLAVGKTLWNRLSPYLGARVFGGPIWFPAFAGALPGHDPDHHAVSVGAVLTLPQNFEVGVDWALTGARGVTAQTAWSF